VGLSSRRLVLDVATPAAIGAVAGACVAALMAGVEGKALDALGRLPGGWPALACLAALPLAVLAAKYVTRTLRPSTSELFISRYHADGKIPIEQLPGRILAAIATVGLGGSQGFESACAMIGSSLSEALSRLRKLGITAEEHRTLVVAGASAGIAAVFSSPGVGTMYGLEVPFRRDVDATRLIPAAVAASTSYAVHSLLDGSRTLVNVTGLAVVDPWFVVGALAVALLCGIGARLFAAACEALRALARRATIWVHVAAASVLLAALAWTGHELSGSWITFGPGYIAASWVQASERAVPLLAILFLVRAAGTLVCVYGGGGGGVFTSLACQGLFLGEIVDRALGLETGHCLALLGAGCFLGAGYRIPLAGVLLVVEQSGDLGLTATAFVATAIAQFLMGDASVSDAQRDHRGV